MPSVKNQEKKDKMGIMKMLMRIKTKCNSVIFSILKTKNDSGLEKVRKGGFFDFRERKSSLSLDFRSFRPSVLDGARSKVYLRGEGYAWVPIWWSSDNSKRQGSFPTCVILWLRVR